MEKSYPSGTGEGGQSIDGGSDRSSGEIFEPWPFAAAIGLCLFAYLVYLVFGGYGRRT